MPCTDGGVPYPPSEEEILARKTPAMLCAILSALPKDALDELLSGIDWKEAGVTQAELMTWWLAHIETDARREARLAAAKASRQLAARARQKLTPEELAAIVRELS